MIKIAGNIVKIELENHTIPTFIKKSGKEWVNYGERNNYPDYLIELYNRNSIHGAIVKGKAAYVYGKGLTYPTDTVNPSLFDVFIETANRYETWDDIFEKTARYFELFNGWAWQIIWNSAGKISEVYVLEMAKLRRSACGTKIFYCDKWINENGKPNLTPDKDPSFKTFDEFNPNIRFGTQIFYFRLDVPTTAKFGHLYPLPEYCQCIIDIETMIEISSFHFNNAKNGMTAQGVLSFFNGLPEDTEKRAIAEMVRTSHTGSLNAGKILLNFVDKQGTEAKYTPFSGTELDKTYQAVSTWLQQNIFSGHRVDPILFGVMTEGSLSDTGSAGVLAKWDKFQKTYVEYRQKIILDQIKFIGEVNGLDLSDLDVEQTSPVGVQLPDDPKILLDLFDKADIQKAYAKKYGIEVTVPAVPGQSAPAAVSNVNENLKKLSGRDWQHIKRIIREVQNGKTPRETGAMLLKNGYALTDDDINILFATPESQFKKFEIERRDRTDELVSLFEKFAIDDTEDQVLNEFEVCGETEALKKELKFQKQLFDNPFLDGSILENALLDIFTGNPFATEAAIAKQLGVPTSLIGIALAALVVAGYLVKDGDSYKPTEKGLARNVEKVETEVYTVYKYQTRPDVPGTETTSRPFCKKMLALSRNGKRWTRDAIDEITNAFGEDAWTYRGGFYTNPNTHETTPFCRHIWKGEIKSRTKKK